LEFVGWKPTTAGVVCTTSFMNERYLLSTHFIQILISISISSAKAFSLAKAFGKALVSHLVVRLSLSKPCLPVILR